MGRRLLASCFFIASLALLAPARAQELECLECEYGAGEGPCGWDSCLISEDPVPGFLPQGGEEGAPPGFSFSRADAERRGVLAAEGLVIHPQPDDDWVRNHSVPPATATSDGTGYGSSLLEDLTSTVPDDLYASAYDRGTAPACELACMLPEGGAPLVVAAGQGAETEVAPDGRPAPSPEAGGIAGNDPVDPATGELVIQETDLAFPGFGIPFTHVRTYRSRIDLLSSLGYGWDFSYNRRLVPTGSIDCAGELAYAAGGGTSLRFREVGRTPTRVLYEAPSGAHLTLRGQLTDGVLTWTIEEPSGTVSRFDERGLLVRLEDPNGLGLTFSWEPSARGDDWRLTSVTDAVGRLIDYEYDDAGWLVRVSHAASNLAASYQQDARGDLVTATQANGRTEHYGYDDDPVRAAAPRDYLPEGYLRDACELACAPNDSACDAGGACDGPVQNAWNQCFASLIICSTSCHGLCSGGCRSHCAAPCQEACETLEPYTLEPGPNFDEAVAECETVWATGADFYCAECRRACDDVCDPIVQAVGFCLTDGEWDYAAAELCAQVGALDGFVNLTECLWNAVTGGEDCVDAFVDDSCYQCCTYGDQCARPAQVCLEGYGDPIPCDPTLRSDCTEDCPPAFCNAAGDACTPGAEGCHYCWSYFYRDYVCQTSDCYADCQRGFWGDPFLDAQELAMLDVCSGEGASLGTGCVGKVAEACERNCGSSCERPCVDECTAACQDECIYDGTFQTSYDYCETFDFMGQCRAGCVEGCIDAEHAAGPVSGPKYGHLADLNHNLLTIQDGNGVVYVVNEYGSDISSPSFDAVVHQTYGESEVEFHYRDLAAEASGDLPPPTADPTFSHVVGREAFDTVAICPEGCPDSAPPPAPPAGEFVPFSDALLAFDLPAQLGGLKTLNQKKGRVIAPTLLRLSPRGGKLIAASPAPLDASQGLLRSFQIETPDGRVTLTPIVSRPGELVVSGRSAARTWLEGVGELTVFTDAGGSLRAYPGAPKGVLHLAEGDCRQPFRATRNDNGSLSLTPANACGDHLGVTPIASRILAPGVTAAFATEGRTALAGVDAFSPTVLAQSRKPAGWSVTASGTFFSDISVDAGSANETRINAVTTGLVGPLFRPPTIATSSSQPLYAFHWTGTKTPPELLVGSADVPAAGPQTILPAFDDPPFYAPLADPTVTCDPALPATAQRGAGDDAPGPKPDRATVVIDAYGVPWTFYYDRRGRLLRQENRVTAAERNWNYDPIGQATGVEDPLGRRLCIDYDGAGSVREILDLPAPGAQGDTAAIKSRFDYTDWPVRLQTIYDPRLPTRALRSLAWDGNGNLTSVTEAPGTAAASTTTFLVGPLGLILSSTGPDGTVTTYEHDETNGTIARVTVNAGTGPVDAQLVSDEAGRPVYAQSPLGAETIWEWVDGRLDSVTSIADGLTTTTAFGYDGDAQLVFATDGRMVVDYDYEPTGALRRAARAALDGSAAASATCRKLGPDGRLLKAVSGEGDRLRITYDGEGRPTQVEVGAVPMGTGAWQDGCESVLGLVYATGVSWSAEYDDAGNATLVRDPRGFATFIDYDGFHRPIIWTYPNGAQTRVGYDAMSHVAWRAEYGFAGAGLPYEQPERTDAALLAYEEYAYDEAGRIIRETAWHFDTDGFDVGDGRSDTTYQHEPSLGRVTVTDDNAQTIVYRFDGAGRPIEVYLPTGDSVTSTYSDGGRTVGRQWSAPTADGWRTELTYLTALGAPQRIETTDDGAPATLAEWVYDAQGRVTAAIEAGGGRTDTIYDAFGRPVRVTSAPDATTAEQVDLAWNRNDWVTSRTSTLIGTTGPTAATSYLHDALGRLRTLTRPSGAAVQMTYTGAWPEPDTRTDERGVTATYAYLSTGEVASVVYQPPETGATLPGCPSCLFSTLQQQTRSFVYDELGRLTSASHTGNSPSVTTDDVTTSFEWDSLGNRTAEWDSLRGVAQAVAHVYDGVGQPTATVYGSRLSIQRAYDGVGRLIDVFEGTVNTVHLSYAGLGGPISRAYASPSGPAASTTYEYDALGRLAHLLDRKPSGLGLTEWTFSTPRDGVRRFATIDTSWSVPSTWVYQVDGARRLERVDSGVTDVGAVSLAASATTEAANTLANDWAGAGTKAQTYQLDGRHNWLSVTKTTTTTQIVCPPCGPVTTTSTSTSPYTFDSGDRLTTAPVGSGVPEYDARGGLTFTGNQSRYNYDVAGDLVEVGFDGAGSRYRFQYDALGRRIAESGSSGTMKLGYDGVRRAMRVSPSGVVTAYVQGDDPDQHLYSLGNSRYYYHQDDQNSVYMTSSSSGSGLEWYVYSPYGERTIYNSSGSKVTATSIPLGFQGHLYDGADLLDMRARVYRPSWGRFLTPDPIDYAGGSNLYAFVDSAPTAFTDPSGLKPFPKNEPQGWDIVQARLDQAFRVAFPTVSAAVPASDGPQLVSDYGEIVQRIIEQGGPTPFEAQDVLPIGRDLDGVGSSYRQVLASPSDHTIIGYAGFFSKNWGFWGRDGNKVPGLGVGPGLESVWYNPVDFLSGAFGARLARGVASSFAQRQTGKGILRIFYDNRPWREISREAWKRYGGARGNSIDHWLIPRVESPGILRGIANAAWNHVIWPKSRLLTRGYFGGDINRFMGMAGPSIKSLFTRGTFGGWGVKNPNFWWAAMLRGSTTALPPAVGFGAYKGTSWLLDDEDGR